MQLNFARGPEIENWFGVEDGTDLAVENDWSFLPFMALSDGAHAYSIPSLRYFGRVKKEADLPRTSPTSRFVGERQNPGCLPPSLVYLAPDN